jgi:hypothetical protein
MYASRVCAEVGKVVGGHLQMPDSTLTYTPEEVLAVKAVRRALAAWGVPRRSLGERELIAFTLNCKCDVDETLGKYRQYLKNLLDEFDIDTMDIWADDAAAREQLQAQWSMVHPAGVDREGRQVMWLTGGGADLLMPPRHIRACCRYFYAVHADLETLRRGVTLVIDTSHRVRSSMHPHRRASALACPLPSARTCPIHLAVMVSL